MVSTEWKSPSNITQDARYKIVNGGTANKFTNLNAMKIQNTTDWCYCINNNGTCDYRASPVLYFNNFNFNIPSTATITKVHIEMVVQEKTYNTGLKTKLVKLKTGASTTDWGVGNNKAQSTKWSEQPKWTTQIYSYSPNEWGVTLQPAQINNANFGCVMQCVGTDDGHKGWGHWSLPRIAYVRMKIDYDIPSQQTVIEKPKFNIKATLNKNLLDINGNDSLNLTITYTHLTSSNNQFVGGNTPTIVLTSNNLKIGSNKANTYTCPILNFPNETSSSTRNTIIPIYPGIQPGNHEIKLTSTDTIITLPIEVINSKDTLLELIDFTKYDKANQKILINKTKFKNCSSKIGGAMYIKTKNFHNQNNTLEQNTATTCPNIWLNDECKN